MGRCGALRMFRSVVVCATVFYLSAAGHVFAGGMLPGPLIVWTSLVLLLIPITLLAGHQLSFATLLGLLSAGQLVLHHVFTTYSPGTSCSSGTADGVGQMVLAAYCEPAGATGMHANGMHESPAMLVAHLIAAVMTAALLSKGEEALWQLLAWLRPLVRFLIPAFIRPAGPQRFTRDPDLIPPPRRNLPVNNLRGPPDAHGLEVLCL